jgi:hypothetical protein
VPPPSETERGCRPVGELRPLSEKAGQLSAVMGLNGWWLDPDAKPSSRSLPDVSVRAAPAAGSGLRRHHP